MNSIHCSGILFKKASSFLLRDRQVDLKRAFGKVLGWFRIEQGYTQEDFSIVSSRTYISSLERGVYSPTLEKLDDIASVIRVHPITLLVAAYALKEHCSVQEVLNAIQSDIESLDLETGIHDMQERNH